MTEWAEYQKWLDEERDFEQTDRVRWTNPPVPASPAPAAAKPEPGLRGHAAGTRPHPAGGNPALTDLSGFRFPATIRGRFVLWQNQADCHPWEIAVATDADGQRRCRWCVYGDDAT